MFGNSRHLFAVVGPESLVRHVRNFLNLGREAQGAIEKEPPFPADENCPHLYAVCAPVENNDTQAQVKFYTEEQMAVALATLTPVHETKVEFTYRDDFEYLHCDNYLVFSREGLHNAHAHYIEQILKLDPEKITYGGRVMRDYPSVVTFAQKGRKIEIVSQFSTVGMRKIIARLEAE